MQQPSVTQTVRVPDPVYDRLTRQAEKQDIPRGVVIREWMEKAEKYEDMEARR